MRLFNGAYCKFLLPLLAFSFFCHAQVSKLDTVFYHMLHTGKIDSAKVKNIEQLMLQYYENGSYDSCIAMAKQGVLFSNGTHMLLSKGLFLHYIAKAYQDQNDFTQARNYYQQAILVRGSVNDSLGLAKSLANLGNIYKEMAEYSKALEFELQALKICEHLGAESTSNNIFNSLGTIYEATADYEKALEYYKRSLDFDIKTNDEAGRAASLGNIGMVYKSDTTDKKNVELAIDHLQRSADLSRKVEDLLTLSNALNALGEIYQVRKKDYGKALAYYEEGKKICQQREDIQGLLVAQLSIATVYTAINKLDEAEKITLQSLQLSKELNTPEYTASAYNNLADIYDKENKPVQAYAAYKKFIGLRDSITSVASQKEMVRHEMDFEFEKKQQAAKADQDKKDALAAAETHRQKLITGAVSVGLFLVLILVIVVYRNLQNNKKKNKIIEEQKNLVEKQKELVEHKNKEITDSITYAKRLQDAILPPVHEVRKHLPQSFILYKPKDIVAGDFYWFSEAKNEVYIAAADCTGHGVPGALMSMVGAEKLNEVIDDHKDVSDILHHVNRHVKKTLRQSGGEDATRDGMDIALCSFDKKLSRVIYAGANRPLWIIRKGSGEVHETKATKTAIGGFTEDDQVFTRHEFDLQTGDTVYMFSDGYADQFSAQDKKLMTKKFKETLLAIQERPLDEQKRYLDDFIETWKAGTEQTDDILVIGVRA